MYVNGCHGICTGCHILLGCHNLCSDVVLRDVMIYEQDAMMNEDVIVNVCMLCVCVYNGSVMMLA